MKNLNTYVVNEKYRSKARKPADFDGFWASVLDDVSRVSLEPEAVPDPLRSSDDIEMSQVHYSSLDKISIAAWACGPGGRGGRRVRERWERSQTARQGCRPALRRPFRSRCTPGTWARSQSGGHGSWW